MGSLLRRAALFAVLLLSNVCICAPEPVLDKRQSTSKYCSPESPKFCYVEVSTTHSNPIYRIAIPDAPSANFDTLLQIVAPVSVGWAGFAWGGGMTLNPLAVAWPNGNKATISSRWATGRTIPTTYSGASYKTLSSSKNSTHWTIEVVCTGCSRWSGGSLNSNIINTFAWAMSRGAVSQPASSSSSFGIHNNIGMFSLDLSTAKLPQSVFQQYISAQSAKTS